MTTKFRMPLRAFSEGWDDEEFDPDCASPTLCKERKGWGTRVPWPDTKDPGLRPPPKFFAILTAQTRQQILGVDWLGQYFELMALGTRTIQQIRGRGLS